MQLPTGDRFDYGLPGYLEAGVVNLLNALKVPNISADGQSLVSGDGTRIFAANLATPEQFGAIGDGSTDDGQAMQDAINSVLFAGVQLTPGSNYKCKNINVPSNKIIAMHGATVTWGGSFGTAPVSENVSAIFYVQGTIGARKTNVEFRGGSLVGSRTGTDYASTGVNEQDSISLQYADNITISGLNFSNAKQDFISIDNVTGLHIDGNYFADSGDVAVDIRAGSSITVTNNKATTIRSLVSCKPNIDGVIVFGNDAATFGIGITGHGPNWHVSQNTLRVATTPDAQNGATSNGIEIYETGGGATGTAFKRAVIEGNTIIGRTSAYGIHLCDSTNGDGSNISVIGNNIEAQLGILVAVGDSIVISNNTVEATTGGGIVVNGGTNISVLGNTVTATTGQAIKSAAVGTVISGNSAKTTGSAEAIYLTSAATDSQIVGNKALGGTIGIVSFAADTVITGNGVASGSSASGAAVSLQGLDATVSGNRLEPTGGEGVLISQAGATLAGNRIKGGTHGVRVSASNCVLTANRISGATNYGVNVSAGATDTVIIGNSLVGNTTAAILDGGTTTLAANNRP